MSRYSTIFGLCLLVIGIYLLFDSVNTKTELPTPQAVFDPLESWKDFTVQNNFIVKFPDTPENTIQSMQDQKTQETRSYSLFVAQTAEGAAYMVSVITFPDGVTQLDDKELMNKIVMEMVDRKDGNSLEKIDSTTFQNLPAYDFNIKGKETTIEGTVFMKDKKLYMLTEVVPYGIKNSEFPFFRNSFHLGD